jgi:hypothetical protein
MGSEISSIGEKHCPSVKSQPVKGNEENFGNMMKKQKCGT